MTELCRFRFAQAGRKTWRRALRCRSGSTTIEFALVLTPLLGLLFGAMQLGLIFEAQSLLDGATEVASRKIMTGAAQTASLSQSSFRTAVCASIPAALLDCSKLMIDVRVVPGIAASDAATPVFTFDAGGQISNSWSYDPGGPDDLVVLRLMYPWPVVVLPGFDLSNLANGKRLIMTTNAVKNEHYQ